MRRNKGLSFYRKRRKINITILSEFLKYLVGICISIFLACVIVYFAGMRTSIIGASMEPVLSNGQEVLINRFIYWLSNPKTGDVVVFRPNGNQNSHYYVKRVVAGPGDSVRIADGTLYVNGEAEGEERYDLIAEAGIAERELKLDAGEYFVLGDNVNSSEDSRSGNIGPVSEEYIIGKAWFYLGGGKGLGLVR